MTSIRRHRTNWHAFFFVLFDVTFLHNNCYRNHHSLKWIACVLQFTRQQCHIANALCACEIGVLRVKRRTNTVLLWPKVHIRFERQRQFDSRSLTVVTVTVCIRLLLWWSEVLIAWCMWTWVLQCISLRLSFLQSNLFVSCRVGIYQ